MNGGLGTVVALLISLPFVALAGWAACAYAGVLNQSGVIALPLHIVGVWCLATGATQLGLMWWGKKHGQAEQMVQGDITRNQFDWDDGTIR
jgi:hypothetical protein